MADDPLTHGGVNGSINRATMAKIAIVGTGIAGLGSAYLLNPDHEITVYEKSARIGGHSRTVTVDYDGQDIAVDTGFIVFNRPTIPISAACSPIWACPPMPAT
jgi:predicted NAD/FAD-binding protein